MTGKIADCVILWITPLLFDMNLKDGDSLLVSWEIHPPHIQTINHGIRKSVDVVCGEDKEDSFTVELEILED